MLSQMLCLKRELSTLEWGSEAFFLRMNLYSELCCYWGEVTTVDRLGFLTLFGERRLHWFSSIWTDFCLAEASRGAFFSPPMGGFSFEKFRLVLGRTSRRLFIASWPNVTFLLPMFGDRSVVFVSAMRKSGVNTFLPFDSSFILHAL